MELSSILGNREYWCQIEHLYDDYVYKKGLFPLNKPVQVILLMREPLSQIISSYNFYASNRQYNKTTGIQDDVVCKTDNLMCSLDDCVNNERCLDRILLRFSASVSRIGPNNYYDMQNKFWFIGITEYYYTSLCMLRYKLGNYFKSIYTFVHVININYYKYN